MNSGIIEDWEKAFDSDLVGRRKSGVSRNRIFRPKDDPNYVIIDLEFDKPENGKSALIALHNYGAVLRKKLCSISKPRYLILLKL